MTAPVSGLLASSGGRPGIRAPGIDVVIGLLPIQYLRYESIPFSGLAAVETILGQQRVPCAAVWVQPVGPSADGNGTPYDLHCRLPGYVETAAGLTAQVVLKSAVYRHVVVVPNVYLGYDQESDGYYVTVLHDGSVQRIPVTVGITNGVVRVITSRVPVGATLLLPSGS